ncbi:MAG: DUF1499 domain-containing protein [Caldilineaceae bacterium]|nr:DUF1499 domain-containing protein [Caldilineaceae bacterium]
MQQSRSRYTPPGATKPGVSKRSVTKRALLYGAGLAILLGVSACAAGQGESSPTTGTFDPQSGRFAPCPDSPNCVSTQATDAEHGIDPYTFTGDAAAAKSALLAVINAMPRTKIVAETDDYLHVEFRSRIFRFVDDVEFFIDDGDKTVQFRSASRLGYSDMGVNRKRMEEIRAKFDAR